MKYYLVFVLCICQGCFTIGTITSVEMTSYKRDSILRGKLPYKYTETFKLATRSYSPTLREIYNTDKLLEKEPIMRRFFTKKDQKQIVDFMGDHWATNGVLFYPQTSFFCGDAIYLYTYRTRKVRQYWKYPLVGIALLIAAPLDVVTFPFQALLGVEIIRVRW